MHHYNNTYHTDDQCDHLADSDRHSTALEDAPLTTPYDNCEHRGTSDPLPLNGCVTLGWLPLWNVHWFTRALPHNICTLSPTTGHPDARYCGWH